LLKITLIKGKGKTWHQLQEAHRRGASQIWIFNVGDIKPLEIPITFAMTLAWDINSIKANSFGKFFTVVAEREFGEELSREVGAVWHQYDRLVSIRKHEHIDPDAFSILHYNEAELILARWKKLLQVAENIYSRTTEVQRPAMFQLVLHPIKSSAIFVALQISLARNQLYARQRRNYANTLAHQVLDLFDADFSLSDEYHTILDGKWNRMMMQPHYGFGDTWHAPSRDMISGLCYVQRRQNSNPIVGQMGIAVEGHEGVRPGRCNEESDRTHPSRRDLVPGLTLGAMTKYGPERWFDVFTRGSPTIHWKASIPYTWIRLSATEGTLIPGEEDARVMVTIDWNHVPSDFNEEVLIDIRSAEGDFEQVHLPIVARQVPRTFMGFVESDGCISISASSCDLGPSYWHLPEVGRASSGSVGLITGSGQDSSYLKYSAYIFTNSRTIEVLLYFNMTLDLDPSDPMMYDILVDDTLQTIILLPESTKDGELPEGWVEAVQDCVWVKKHTFSDNKSWSGAHTIQVKLKHTNLLLEKLIVNLGGLQESYLGPPPSHCIHTLG
jgi:Gylcosyl hydrolase family 115 C-terminal domain/Glycosyl hydrolase family 115